MDILRRYEAQGRKEASQFVQESVLIGKRIVAIEDHTAFYDSLWDSLCPHLRGACDCEGRIINGRRSHGLQSRLLLRSEPTFTGGSMDFNVKFCTIKAEETEQDNSWLESHMTVKDPYKETVNTSELQQQPTRTGK